MTRKKFDNANLYMIAGQVLGRALSSGLSLVRSPTRHPLFDGQEQPLVHQNFQLSNRRTSKAEGLEPLRVIVTV